MMSEQPMDEEGACEEGPGVQPAIDEQSLSDPPGQQSLSETRNNNNSQTMSETRSTIQSISDSTLQSVSQCPPQPDLKSVDEQYATQFLGFTPKSFCNGIYNAFNEFVTDHLQSLSIFLVQQFDKDISTEMAEQGCEELRRGFISTFDKSFDKLEKYLEGNLLRIPNYVSLEEDRVHETGDPTAEEEAKLDEDIRRLTNKILATKYANTSLTQELKDGEFAQSLCDHILSQFVTLEKTMKQSKVVDLKESLIFTADKAEKCIDVIQRLPPMTDSSSPREQMDSLKQTEVDKLLMHQK